MISFAVVVLLLNHYQFYTAAKICLFTTWVVGITFFSYNYLGGFYGGSFVVLFSAVPWAFMLFDIKQKIHISWCLGLLFSCFTLLISLQYIHPLPVTVQLNLDVVRISTTVLTILILLLITWYFYSSNIAAEENLINEKKKSDTANRAKSTFLSHMSHELRTPLNAILGFSELMRRDSDITLEQQSNLETIGRSGEHLLSLINDILEFSKIEAGQNALHQEIFDLYQLILGLEEMFLLRAQQKELSLDFTLRADVPHYIRTDQNKLRQILINLIGNAVKFTQTGGITLSVTRQARDNHTESDGCLLRFEVADTGIGITLEEQDTIFDPFFQSDSQHSSQQGTGLGLPISKKFVVLMGGELTVNSDIGKGSNFIFDIPVELADGVDANAIQLRLRATALADGQPVYRLLVVEDNKNNRNLLVKLLRIVGFEVQEAVNGKDAIEICHQWKPHLIWMDMRMPIMDGYEATSQIRGLPGGEDTVIIALTASAFEEDRKKIIEHGGNDFIRKPFREAEIFRMLEKHLGVEFIYEACGEDNRNKAQADRQNSIEILKSQIATLPVETLARLAESTELSDAVMIDEVIDDIRIENVDLAEALAGRAENFAYDDILALVQHAKSTTTS